MTLAPFTAQRLEGAHHSFGGATPVGLPNKMPPRCQLLPRAHPTYRVGVHRVMQLARPGRRCQNLVAVRVVSGTKATRATVTAGERRRRGIGWPPCPAVAAARARRTPTHLTLPGAAGRSRNIDLQTDSGGAGTGESGPVGAVPSKCGRRHRPFVLVSCRFHPEIGARLVTRSHYGHAMPLVYPGEPSMGAFGPLSAAPPNPEMGGRPHAQFLGHLFFAPPNA